MKLFILIFLFPLFIHAQNCSNIYEEIDKFENSVMYSTLTGSPIDFYKAIKAKDTVYVITVSAILGYRKQNISGVYLLFSNGIKIEKPLEPIDCKYNDSDYKIYATFKLSKKEINLFKNYQLTDYKLFMYNNSISDNDQISIQNTFNCLSKNKIHMPEDTFKECAGDQAKIEPIKIITLTGH